MKLTYDGDPSSMLSWDQLKDILIDSKQKLSILEEEIPEELITEFMIQLKHKKLRDKIRNEKLSTYLL